MNPEAGVETIKDMAPSQLADALEQMQQALNAFRDELQPHERIKSKDTLARGNDAEPRGKPSLSDLGITKSQSSRWQIR